MVAPAQRTPDYIDRGLVGVAKYRWCMVCLSEYYKSRYTGNATLIARDQQVLIFDAMRYEGSTLNVQPLSTLP
jgi:hypothetical protein